MGKVLWLDTETTGLDPKQCVPVQIAGIIDIDGEVKEKFNLFTRPFYDSLITAKALEVTGKTAEDIWAYPEPAVTFKILEDILGKYVNKYDRNDKFLLAGQKVDFDLDMMYNWFLKNGSTYLGSWISFKYKFDTLYIVQALQIIGKLPVLPNNKLTSLCEHFKVPLANAHDCMADIEATRAVGLELVKMLDTIKEVG